MRKLAFGAPPNTSTEAKIDWCVKSLKALEVASHEIDVQAVADAYTVNNVTPTRILDANTGTLADLAAVETALDVVRDVLATFIQDIKRRGPKRTGN